MTTATYDPTPVTGYGEGLVKADELPERIKSDDVENDWHVFGGYRFNVHPFRSDLDGYPVRWIESEETYPDTDIRKAVRGRDIGAITV